MAIVPRWLPISARLMPNVTHHYRLQSGLRVSIWINFANPMPNWLRRARARASEPDAIGNVRFGSKADVRGNRSTDRVASQSSISALLLRHASKARPGLGDERIDVIEFALIASAFEPKRT